MATKKIEKDIKKASGMNNVIKVSVSLRGVEDDAAIRNSL